VGGRERGGSSGGGAAKEEGGEGPIKKTPVEAKTSKACTMKPVITNEAAGCGKRESPFLGEAASIL